MDRRGQLRMALILMLATLSPVWAQDGSAKSVQAARRGILGITVQDITPETTQQFGLAQPSGVLITHVQPGSPAEAAGLKNNDVILSYNGAPVQGVVEFQRLVRETPAGRIVTLGVLRDRQETQLQATLAPSRSYQVRAARRSRTAVKRPTRLRLGIQTINLTPQLAQYFGVQTGKGVLVAAIQENTTAARAGLRAGDVIVAVNGQEIGRDADLRSAFSRLEGNATLSIVRNHAQQELPVTLEPRQPGASAVRPQRIKRQARPRTRIL